MKTPIERLYNGIVKENPTFVLMLGMCPTLAVTTSAINGLGMGLATTVVLVMSNMLISLLRKVIPDGVRMPAYIVIVASFVTIVQMVLQAYVTSLYDALGLYIPLIVVNCIILGRAESYASKNKVIPSIFDGLGMGLGFTIGLTSIEGSEMKALDGATKTIKRNLPKLYVCAYHRNEDLFALGKKILSFDKRYKLYFRHSLYIPAWESNFYAIID